MSTIAPTEPPTSLPASLIFDPFGDVTLILSKTKLLTRTTTAAEVRATCQNFKRKAPDAEFIVDPNENDEKIEIKVSSRHLALASRVFRVMFDGHFRERVEPGDPQLRRFPLPDDNAEAMNILLAMVHGLNRRVPRSVTRSELVQLAILIDKYDLHEASEVFTDIWFRGLWGQWTTLSGIAHSAEWIFLCWVFKKESEFSEITRLVIKTSPQIDFDDQGLPLPRAVGTLFRTRRLSAIEDLTGHIMTTIDRYTGTSRQCLRDAHCDLLVLGDLIKKLTSRQLFPVPHAFFVTMSFDDIWSALNSLELTSLCKIEADKFASRAHFGSPPANQQHLCSMNSALIADLGWTYTNLTGLALSDLDITSDT